MQVLEILEKARGETELTKEEIVFLLSTSDQEDKEKIFRLAGELTLKNLGPEIHLRGIVEFSNYCCRNCNYCGLRLDNEKLVRYRMSPEEIVAQSEEVADLGLGTVVLQSGEDYWYTKDMITDIIREIKAKTDLAITLSLGERKFDELKAWREVGADRYLLKQETVNSTIFKEIKPDSRYEERFEVLEHLADLGYQVGSGGMIGLPGQLIEDLADDLIYIREKPVGMAGFGPFISHGDTPFSMLPNGDGELTLLLLAVARIVLKKVFLPATTALETLIPDGRQKAIKTGANVIMPNMTPLKYRKLYEIYPNKAQTDLDEVVELINSIRRVVGKGRGDTF
ncbi:MAG: [FeFe] hydrogenase H-cluster radical SAM maturase HydE [Halanaerobiales bacterium]|nr:[FeFe] hydrogenase H-cluster radical SAM maturase HydE [Halanaerobiales bacterium]